MKKKIQVAFNSLFIFSIFIGIVLIILGKDVVTTEKEIALGIGLMLVGVIFVGVSVVFCPWIYTFDEDGISLNYIFLPKERYLWRNIKQINIDYSSDSDSKYGIFELLFSNYNLDAVAEGKTRFYMSGKVRKTFRIKRLLSKYWDGQVEGLFDVFFASGRKSKYKSGIKKRNKPKKNYDADDVIALEKSLYNMSKELIKPYIDRAAQLGLEMRTSYLYVSKNGEQYKKRPDKDYRYMFLAEISCPNETDKTKSVEVSVDLVFVRLGRNAYRGVENKTAFEELNIYMTDVFDEIEKNGFEAFVG